MLEVLYIFHKKTNRNENSNSSMNKLYAPVCRGSLESN
jgi:hypothetical protein